MLNGLKHFFAISIVAIVSFLQPHVAHIPVKPAMAPATAVNISLAPTPLTAATLPLTPTPTFKYPNQIAGTTETCVTFTKLDTGEKRCIYRNEIAKYGISSEQFEAKRQNPNQIITNTSKNDNSQYNETEDELTDINKNDDNFISPNPVPTKESQINILGGSSSYSQYGNTLYGSNGDTYTKYGNTTYGNDGSTYSQYGNTVYDNDGSTYSKYGNTVYGNDGTSYSTYGNTTYGSDGSSATRYGNTTYMNDGY